MIPMAKLVLLSIPIGVLILAGCNKQSPQSQPAPLSATTPTAQPATLNVLPAPKTYDGPFGLAGSMSVEELKKLDFKQSGSDPDIFRGMVPKHLEGVSTYTVLATPKSGLCRVRAMVTVETVNGSGDQLRQKVDELADMMSIKYGKHSSKSTYIGQDVYRRNPQYWMMGLKEESVEYAYRWQAGKASQPLPTDLEDIEIMAVGSSSDSGYAAIQYTFRNFEDCMKEIETRKAANL